MKYEAAVYLDHNAQPLIVFAKGRLKYHAIEAGNTVRLVTLDNLRGLRQPLYKGDVYPPRRAASFYLNHSVREITPRAKSILRALVARKPRTPDAP